MFLDGLRHILRLDLAVQRAVGVEHHRDAADDGFGLWYNLD